MNRPDLVARSRAFYRLAGRYPGVFAQLLAEEYERIGYVPVERGPRTCAHCGRPARRYFDRCDTCYRYRRRHGRERPAALLEARR